MKVNLWTVGFILMIMGIGIPVSYGIYQVVLAEIEWYWSVSITLIIFGFIFLLISAVKERNESSKPEEKV